jgi:hypothetical protein
MFSGRLSRAGTWQGFPMTALSAPVRSKLVAHYRQQAEVCLRMAKEALSPYDEEWLRLAAKWTKLARQAEVRAGPAVTADID